MALAASFPNPSNPARRYLREPIRVYFPVGEEVPEGAVHLELRTLLYLLLRRELSGRAFVGSDQFLYWDSADPRKCLSPDVMLRLGSPDVPRQTVKVWEDGAPHLAVEFMSPSDKFERKWASKLQDYRSTGILEVVRFDVENLEQPLSLWDHVDGDLIERDPSDPSAFRCDCLGLYWCVRPDERLGQTLRLARDPQGLDLLLTAEESLALERAERDRERDRERAERDRERAEQAARIAALEAELKRLKP